MKDLNLSRDESTKKKTHLLKKISNVFVQELIYVQLGAVNANSCFHIQKSSVMKLVAQREFEGF